MKAYPIQAFKLGLINMNGTTLKILRDKNLGLTQDLSKTLLIFCISCIILIFLKTIKLTSRIYNESLPPIQTFELSLINMNEMTLIILIDKNLRLIHELNKTLLMFCVSCIILIFF